MAAGDRSDTLKLWLFPAAVTLLAAWMAPLVFNAGKALAEVSRSKTTNGPLEWLAGQCGRAGFPQFYEASLALAALALFLPWCEWLAAGRQSPVAGWQPPGPWRLRPRLRMGGHGQPLHSYPRRIWHGCAGFLLAAGLTLSMGLAMVPAGLGTMRPAAAGFGHLLVSLLPAALMLGLLQEFLFRGLAMGIFLRAMKPSAAIAMTALYFAVVHLLIPPDGVTVADPEASGTGWEMLGNTLHHLAGGAGFLGTFLPMFALGALLSYARWRTASLWLPVGLHTGWLCARSAMATLVSPAPGQGAGPAADILREGIIPIATLVAVAVLAHLLTRHPEDERAVES